MRGVIICIENMFSDQDIYDKINMQRDMYKETSDMFGFSYEPIISRTRKCHVSTNYKD